ncbi:MAG: imidazolonepropionase [Deltaproteobacteria bacterium]|nr:imidazolonepropionase [Deltaproteobacteria bacterium]
MSFDTRPKNGKIVFVNLSSLATLNPALVELHNPMGTIKGAAIAVRSGKVEWVGKESRLPGEYSGYERFDCTGMLGVPGLVECHTHLVFAGQRSEEFQMRNAGAGYGEILQAGGGLLSTVKATRSAGEDELVQAALPRLQRFLEQGVTTCEIKSGYGLNLENELKILRVVNKLKALTPITLVGTFLGAHAIPLEYRSKREYYIDLVTKEMIPAVAEQNLAVFCDVFCERVAFNLKEAEKILRAGRDAGLAAKIHADQLSSFGGCRLAADMEAVSADHCDKVTSGDASAMAEKGVTAVLLPGATFFLGERQYAPARMLLDKGVHVALSTDCNPGSAMTENIQLMTTFGGSMMNMNTAELLKAVTIESARALNMDDSVGTIESGKDADIALMDCPDPGYIPYHFGTSHVAAVIKRGNVVFAR